MAITNITIANFKGVGEEVTIPLRPITLLFGANSAGKSTILQALLYLRDVLEHRHTDLDRLHISGATIDLGGFQKLVHGRDTKKSVKVGVTVTVDDDGLNTYGRAPYSDDDDEEGIRIEDQMPLPLPGVREVTVTVTIGWDPGANRTQVLRYEVAVNGKSIGNIRDWVPGPHELKATGPILTMVEEHPAFSSLFRFGNPKERRDPNDEENVGQLGYLSMPYYEVLGMVLPNIGQPLRLLSGPNTGSTQLSTQDAEELFSHIMVGAGQAVLNELNRMRYVGPLRIVPPRSFHSVRSPDDARWSDGSAAWDLLHRSEDDFDWFNARQFASLGLGYRFDQHRYFEIPAQSVLGGAIEGVILGLDTGTFDLDYIPASDFDMVKEKRRLTLLSEETGLEVDPSDVGVGVSQLIPVVVGAMASGYSLLAVEQPELHIHPAIQCNLADVLAHQIIDDEERQILLETHSEHLMLRLLRRVRETSEDELPPDAPELTPEDVSVLYVSNDAGKVTITHLPITEDGDFARAWPKGFFEERSGELF